LTNSDRSLVETCQNDGDAPFATRSDRAVTRPRLRVAAGAGAIAGFLVAGGATIPVVAADPGHSRDGGGSHRDGGSRGDGSSRRDGGAAHRDGGPRRAGGDSGRDGAGRYG